MALKIDISKAYDRVDWGYLKGMLRRLGFNEKWVGWMTMCLETVNYSIMVNGEKVGPIAPGRGLRQGDPLSPYLFIICAEGLTTLLRRAEARGDLHGVRVCRGAPSLTHLLFADDCFLFCRADELESNKLKEILATYERASGQAINLQKSEVYFSKNTLQEKRDFIINLLGVAECMGTGKYLGLPSMIGRNKKQIFSYLRDRMWRKIQHWSGKRLSKAGREVLVKSVAQAIPSYCMSAFMLPTTLGEELERMLNSFWWGTNNNDRRGIRWLSWRKLTMRKEHGGLGFRHFHGFNMAMLGKQAWKIATHADTIVAKVFKAKYFPDCDFMGARLGHNPSFVWRSIFSSRVLVKLGARWKIGNGEQISVWNDPWLKGGKDAYIRSPLVPGTDNMKVKDLWKQNTMEWDRNLVNLLFNSQEASRIGAMPILNDHDDDRMIWNKSRSGNYTVKSAYYMYMEDLMAQTSLRVDGDWMRIWKLKIPSKVKLLLWRACRGCLPTRCNLQSRHVPCEWLCPFCERNPENEWHIFLACPHNEAAWHTAGLYSRVNDAMDSSESFRECFFSLLNSLDEQSCKVAAMVLWALWKRRNDRVWEGITQPLEFVIGKAMVFLTEWSGARAHVADVAGREIGAQIVAVAWQKPAAGLLKCNVDAGLFVDENRYGIGICIRNEFGEFYRGKTICFEGIPSPQEAEAMGLWQALLWLRDLGLSLVSIELDCLPVVHGVQGEPNTNTEFGSLLSYCKNFLSNVQSFTVSYVRRQANRVAHTLARVARFNASSQVYEYIPNCIQSLIINEMS